jgi:hypothetical protein
VEVSFICLANSRKLNGRCVAGIRLDGGSWIRPVSRQVSGTLSRRQYLLDDGADATPLDIVSVQVSGARPELHQPENSVVGRERWRVIDWILGTPRWRLVERLNFVDALPVLEKHLWPGPDLLGDRRDRVIYDDLRGLAAKASLALIEPRDVVWVIKEAYRGNKVHRQTRASFRLKGQRCNLPVTDPLWEQKLAHLPYGLHQSDAARVPSNERLFFTISLGEPFQGACFKLVAAVMIPPR